MSVLNLQATWLTFGTNNRCAGTEAEEYWSAIGEGDEDATTTRLTAAKNSIPSRISTANPSWLCIPSTATARISRRCWSGR